MEINAVKELPGVENGLGSTKTAPLGSEDGVQLLPVLGLWDDTDLVPPDLSAGPTPEKEVYRMYKRRWVGLIAILVLNLLNAISWIWAAAIAPAVSEHFQGLPLTAINWLGNIVNVIFLPSCLFVPYLGTRLSIRRLMMISAGMTVLSGWVRYAATAQFSGWGRPYVFLMLAQVMTGIGQPIGLVIGPKYSQAWFDENSRMIATMVVSIGAPLGGAVGQAITPLMAPRADRVPFCILIIACFSTAGSLAVFFIGDRPPTPPSRAAALPTPSFKDSIKLLLQSSSSSMYGAQVMSRRERLDLWIIIFAFGVLVGTFSTLATLVNQLFTPFGYSANAAGNMGAGLIGAGLIAAAISSPVFDKVLKTRLALSVKFILPVVSASFIALIFELKPSNTTVIVVLLILIGSGMFMLLPIALELAVEVSRSPEASASLLWFSGNVFSVIFILVLDSLRAKHADPWGPERNLRRGVVFLAVWVVATSVAALGLVGRQVRRMGDVEWKMAGVKS